MKNENVTIIVGITFISAFLLAVFISTLDNESWDKISVCSEFKDKCYNTVEGRLSSDYVNLTKITIPCEQEHQYKERICYTVIMR
ncbi:hypothetical protein D4Q76_02725 [archaeon]|nr:MAG: hypothetical protein D4Q76_02725 [archaeon]